AALSEVAGQEIPCGQDVLHDPDEGAILPNDGRRSVLANRGLQGQLTDYYERQDETEHAAFTELALQPDPPTVQLHKPSRQRQAESGTLLLPGVGRIDLLEGGEDA